MRKIEAMEMNWNKITDIPELKNIEKGFLDRIKEEGLIIN